MAAPAFGSAGSQLQGTAADMNVDVPDSVAAGDIIVVTAFVDLDGTVTGLPTGFAQAPDSPVVVNPGLSFRHRLYVMWKRATGADDTGTTYDFTLSGSVYRNAQAIRYTGAIASGDPWDVTNAAQSGDTSVTATPAVSDTTTVADTLLIWGATNWSGGAWTPPTSFTERRDSGDRVCTAADLAQAAAGATGSISGTCAGSGRSGAWLGALKPVSGTSVTGTAAGAYTFTGTAAGTPRTPGTAAGAYAFAGTASGQPRTLGVAAAAFAFAGTAVGAATSVVQGTALGAYTFLGRVSQSGINPTPPVPGTVTITITAS